MKSIQISGTSGSIIFDFDGKIIRLLRTGTAVEILKLKDMAISFDEVTGIEIQQPTMMKSGGCVFIVNNKRLLSEGPSIEVDATQFATISQKDFMTLENAIQQMCSLNPSIEIRNRKGFNVEKVYYSAPKFTEASQQKSIDDTPKSSNEENHDENQSSINSTEEEIINVAKVAVCNQLKSPASAQFPSELIKVSGDDISGYKVTGFVDSQNSYGAMIRNDFSVDIAIVNDKPIVKAAYVALATNAARSKQFRLNYIAALIMTAIGGLIFYFIIKLIAGL